MAQATAAVTAPFAQAKTRLKGGIRHNGEESQGREEEGRQEALSRPLPYKGGGRRPLFIFSLRSFPAPTTPPRNPQNRAEAIGCSATDIASALLHRLTVPDAHVANEIPALQLVGDLDASDDATDDGAMRVSVRHR